MPWRVTFAPEPPGVRNRYGAQCERCTGWCAPGDGTVIRTPEGNTVEHMDCTGKQDDRRPYRNRRHCMKFIGSEPGPDECDAPSLAEEGD